MKKTIFVSLLAVGLLLISPARSFSQSDDVEGKYSVGKTSCTITWDERDHVDKVYWSVGTGNTTLFYKNVSPNGNIVYDEYDDTNTDYLGTFTFKNESLSRGIYTRADGKEFTIKRKR